MYESNNQLITGILVLLDVTSSNLVYAIPYEIM